METQNRRSEAPQRVSIVPHTHWDREWYAPFQTYRLRLVALLDEFLPLLERDPGYRHFLLDGQTAVVDDYLEIRPEAEARIRRLVTSGRLSLGPWMILMDEFMVSGETMVRNLQMGLERAAELGGAMPVGYLPDMFGHVAQMPQILHQAGLEHAVVWRGVPAAIRCTGFWWEAPDGSRVRAEYLYGSYSNGRDMPREPGRLVERARNYEAELGDARLDGMLMMNGTDHQVPQAWLGPVVAEANAAQSDYAFSVTSLADHLAHQPTDGLPTWRGELRSGARANLLMGVASNRVDVHQAAAAAERAVERWAEPLAALALPADRYPASLLDVAWRNLVLNSAHDSSCACSHDEVVDQVLVRYREARQIGAGVGRDAVHALAAQVAGPPGTAVVVNPSHRPRSGLVEVPVAGEGPLHFAGPDGSARPAQVVGGETGERFAAHVVGSKLGWILDMMRGEEFAGAPVASFTVTPRPAGADTGPDVPAGPPAYDVVVQAAGPGEPGVDVGPLRDRLLELAGPAIGAGPPADPSTETVFHVRMLHTPIRRVLLHAAAVPGYGWHAYRPVEGDVPPPPGGGGGGGDGAGSVAAAPLVRADGRRMTNDHVTVEVAGDGTFSLEAGGISVSGLNRYVNGGDGGDTYNWSPPADDLVVDGVDGPDDVTVEVVEHGPLRARLLVTTRHRWPTHAEGDERSCSRRSTATADVTLRTTLELRAGEPFVRVRTEFDNPCRDQRLRAHFPLPSRVEGSDAECAFAVVHRGLESEGGPSEAGLPTFPSRRFVDCSGGGAGLAVLHDGLLEYEVVDGGQELALTLLRSVGYLSRLEPALRPNPAGPPVPVEGAQMPGRQVMEYAVMLHPAGWQEAGLHARADEFLVALGRAPAGGADAPLPESGSLLHVEGAEVSACHRTAAGLVLRVFNPAGEPAELRVSSPDGPPATGWAVDLRGRPLEPFTGTLGLAPGRITTVVLPEA